jgi:hypothetical protein
MAEIPIAQDSRPKRDVAIKVSGHTSILMTRLACVIPVATPRGILHPI